MRDFNVVIPVFNGGSLFLQLCKKLSTSIMNPSDVIIVDSGSIDGSLKVAEDYGFLVIKIPNEQFSHSATRTDALQYVTKPYVVFLTQDAIPEDSTSIKKLVDSCAELGLAAVFGRQLPHHQANSIARATRSFSYGARSYTTSLQDSEPVGLKKIFMSNSFCCYDTVKLASIGGFGVDTRFGEDTLAAAKFLSQGFRIGYCAEAVVRHSHDYTLLQELKRNFDIGVFHQQQYATFKIFGPAEREGRRFVGYLFKRAFQTFDILLALTIAPYIISRMCGYYLGKHYLSLPPFLRRKISTH